MPLLITVHVWLINQWLQIGCGRTIPTPSLPTLFFFLDRRYPSCNGSPELKSDRPLPHNLPACSLFPLPACHRISEEKLPITSQNGCFAIATVSLQYCPLNRFISIQLRRLILIPVCRTPHTSRDSAKHAGRAQESITLITCPCLGVN